MHRNPVTAAAGLAALCVAIGITVTTATALTAVSGPFPTPVTEIFGPVEATNIGAGGEHAQSPMVAWVERASGDPNVVLLEGFIPSRPSANGEFFSKSIELPFPVAAAEITAPVVWYGPNRGSQFPGVEADVDVIAFVAAWPDRNRWLLIIESNLLEPSRHEFEHPIRDPAVHGETIVWSDARDGRFALWSMTTEERTPQHLGDDLGDLVHPSLSDEWLVWVETDRHIWSDRVMARRRQGGEATEVLAHDGIGRFGPPVVVGSRVLFSTSSTWPLYGKALWVHDLDSGDQGVVGVIDEPGGGYDLSEEFIVWGLADSESDAFQGKLVAHDVRAITSFHNLTGYLTAFHVAKTVTASAVPKVVGDDVFWADSRSDNGSQAVNVVTIRRGLVHLPVAVNQP